MVLDGSAKALGESLFTASSQFGVGALKKIGDGAKATVVAVKGAVVAVAPCVVGVAGLYGSYKLYRHLNPTLEEIAQMEKLKVQATQAAEQAAAQSAAQIAQHNAHAAQSLLEVVKAQREQALELAKSVKEQAFHESLLQNLTSPRDASGLPIACQKAACDYAFVAGKECVTEKIRAFNQCAPLPQKPLWDKAKEVGSCAVGCAHTIITAPFDYTIGLVANESGLSCYVSNTDFIRNNSCYSATIGNGVIKVSKYVFAAAVVYYTLKGAKAAYKKVRANREDEAAGAAAAVAHQPA